MTKKNMIIGVFLGIASAGIVISSKNFVEYRVQRNLKQDQPDHLDHSQDKTLVKHHTLQSLYTSRDVQLV